VAAPIPWPIEVLDGEDEGIDGLVEK